ncbi:hypothetical protein ABEG18_23715 [Alsobacter sp. KACC 23698]|uniref:Uncharacterized protein n=1 Tax=Alsobacter sp. KACC 23698 TaxID=3149229 RepID=A0AAU7JEH9_9HYPH
MSRRAPGGPVRRRKFKVRMPGATAQKPEQPDAPSHPADEAEDEERAANYLEEEAQRPFTPEVYLIKRPR